MRIPLFLAFACFFLCPGMAAADTYKLNTGEVLADSEYQTLHAVGGPKRLVLEVTFEDKDPDPVIRNASLLEILTNHLLPMAAKKGFSEVSIWETKLETPSGKKKKSIISFNVNAAVYENYDFVLGDQWIWEQTSGPDLDISVLSRAEYTYNPELDVYATNAFPHSLEDGEFYFEIWANAEGASPSEAADKANDLFRMLSGCKEDGVPIETDSFLGQHGAIALKIYMVPYRTTSQLRYQPRLSLNYGHENGVPTCYTISNIKYESWNEVYALLKK